MVTFSPMKVLFEVCPSSTQCLVANPGPQKDMKNVKSFLKLLNEVVSHDVSLEVSCLLGKIEHLSTSISSMKQAMSMQTCVCEDLRTVIADIN